MCKEIQDSKRGNRWVYFFAIMACTFATTLAYAAEIPDAIDAAERVDRMGAMGVLAFGFILSMVGLIYLIRLQYGRMLTVIERNTEVAQKSIDASTQVIRVIEDCKFRRGAK